MKISISSEGNCKHYPCYPSLSGEDFLDAMLFVSISPRTSVESRSVPSRSDVVYIRYAYSRGTGSMVCCSFENLAHLTTSEAIFSTCLNPVPLLAFTIRQKPCHPKIPEPQHNTIYLPQWLVSGVPLVCSYYPACSSS